jgi:c-di-GMP-binding flagellar brake protein YcgR
VAGQLKLEDLQSFEDLFAPKTESKGPIREQRRSDRKTAELPGKITVDGYMSVIQTVDLSLGGMSLRAERLLGVGKEAHISFSLDDTHAVAATVRIVYCFYTQDEDFRAGLEFLKISNGADALTQFLQS